MLVASVNIPPNRSMSMDGLMGPSAVEAARASLGTGDGAVTEGLRPRSRLLKSAGTHYSRGVHYAG
jgi:hypothetical protein